MTVWHLHEALAFDFSLGSANQDLQLMLFLIASNNCLLALGYRVHIVTCSKAMDGISTRLARTVTGEKGQNSALGSYTILPCGDNEGHRTTEVLDAIRDVGPDAIVYNDVSMEGSSYLLAQYVLADHC